MNTERSLDHAPKQEKEFDPDSHQDPVSGLTLLIRQLRLGERVRMPDDTLVISRTVQVGPHQERRFSVVPSPEKSTAQERHRMVTLGHGACKTAEQAAKKALNRGATS